MSDEMKYQKERSDAWFAVFELCDSFGMDAGRSTKSGRETVLDFIRTMQARLTAAEQERDALKEQVDEAIEKITEWRDKAYPLEVFPEPNFKEIQKLLGDINLTLVSASNMRHVTTRVCEILAAALGKVAK